MKFLSEAHRALELLEDYHSRLSSPQDRALRIAIERVIRIFKSRLFQALLGKYRPKNIFLLHYSLYRIYIDIVCVFLYNTFIVYEHDSKGLQFCLFQRRLDNHLQYKFFYCCSLSTIFAIYSRTSINIANFIANIYILLP